MLKRQNSLPQQRINHRLHSKLGLIREITGDKGDGKANGSEVEDQLRPCRMAEQGPNGPLLIQHLSISLCFNRVSHKEIIAQGGHLAHLVLCRATQTFFIALLTQQSCNYPKMTTNLFDITTLKSWQDPGLFHSLHQ